MDWGSELWDKFDVLISDSYRNYEQNDRFIHFFKERCSVEREYSKSLKKLIKNFQQKKSDDTEFTVTKGLNKLFDELFDLAGQHETIADRISESIIKNMSTFQVESKQNRKRSQQEGEKLSIQLKNQKDKLDKAKRRYEKAFSDAEKAEETYKKMEQDMNLPKIDIDKSRQVMEVKQQFLEECKKDYAYEVSVINNYQREHYNKLMPEVFKQLQTQEEMRVDKVKECVSHLVCIESDVVPIVNRCIEGFTASANQIDSAKDSMLTIEKHKTGFPIPGDIPFEDLSSCSSSHSGSNETFRNPYNVSNGNSSMKKGLKGYFRMFGNKQEEPKDDFSHLPPKQQRKALLAKLDQLQSELRKLNQEREALNKMRDVYSKNSNLGDPASTDKQLNEVSVAIGKLEAEQQKFKSYLASCSGDSANNSPAQARRPHDDNNSLNSRTSNISINNPQISEPSSMPGTQQINASRISAGDRMDSFSDDDFNDEFDQRDQGGRKCKALYAFDGQGDESALPMVEGEVFVFLEDEGGGWLRVKREATDDEGYVPSTYVQML